MKFKISWPTGIIIAISAFVIFILSFVYKVTFLPQYDHHLVSDNYYEDELNYQKEINKLNEASELAQNITFKKTTLGLLIIFPSEFEPSDIKGVISFVRMSNNKNDFQFPINLKTNEHLIKDADLVEGRWNVKIEWTVNNTTYLLKEKIIY